MCLCGSDLNVNVCVCVCVCVCEREREREREREKGGGLEDHLFAQIAGVSGQPCKRSFGSWKLKVGEFVMVKLSDVLTNRQCIR